MNAFALALRFARRELRSGLSGFRIFFACLVLGVAAIAGVGSLSQAFLTGLSDQGRVILGGDVSVGLVHREATTQELAFLKARGRISEITSMRAMAYAIKNDAEAERQLIELKAVDDGYPLYGSVSIAPKQSLVPALACASGTCGALVEQTLFYRLHAKTGGIIRIGTQNFRIAGVLTNEPDRLSGGFALGPHVMVSREGLSHTGLVTLGSLINYTYRVAMSQSASVAAFHTDATARFPDAGWEINDRTKAAPGLSRFVDELTMFLTLVGLTALAVGGVGASQAVSAFLDRKREEIATLKSLGATGDFIFLVFLLQVMIIAFVAVIVGLIIGAALPFAVAAGYGNSIPIPAHYTTYPDALILAALFGLLSAAAFAIPPLARAREIAPASLFRDIVSPASARGRWPYLAISAVAALLVLALALVLSPSPVFAAEFLGSVAGGLVVLRLCAGGLRWILRRVPRPHRPGLRLALANLTRPGAGTTGVVVALGLGLTLLTAVTLIDGTISDQVQGDLPQTAPSFFFVDIQPDQTAAFDKIVIGARTATDYKRTPMIRGRITALNGVPSAKAKVASEAKWAISGDRGITYAAMPPKGTDIAEGKWWGANYQGPTQISFDEDLAKPMGLKLGDTLTLNVLGREMTGKITSFRNVDFSNGQQNFILILSLGVIDKAPHSFLATVRVAPAEEEPLYRAVTDRFPNISTVRVKDVIGDVNNLIQQLGDGMQLASLVTILAGLLVLAGAIAAGNRARLYDSTVLKVLGATRAQIAAIYAMEYGLIGALTGILALGAGTFAAWIVAVRVLQVDFSFDWGTALLTVVGGGMATLLFGLGGAWAALAAKPAQTLRNP
ncbi:MAG TPA: FtsX-like permease family protein [Rhizomicrobium sp.]|jgi:putative ABC transport system permease protein|nr:FtsX-like permease family protein [Rhizomicrobium sp.]